MIGYCSHWPCTVWRTPAGEAGATSREETPTAFRQPQWSANKHEGGVDIEVTLPGVSKEDVDVQVRGSHLELEARRNKPAENRGRLVYGTPAPQGYRLRLRLGESLDGNRLEASLADGILKVAIPLVEAAKPKKIDIR